MRLQRKRFGKENRLSIPLKAGSFFFSAVSICIKYKEKCRWKIKTIGIGHIKIVKNLANEKNIWTILNPPIMSKKLPRSQQESEEDIAKKDYGV